MRTSRAAVWNRDPDAYEKIKEKDAARQRLFRAAKKKMGSDNHEVSTPAGLKKRKVNDST